MDQPSRRSFLLSHAHRKTWSLQWLQGISHEYLNQPSVADADVMTFFKDTLPLLPNTIVVFFSDHGHRYDRLRNTVGKSR